MNRALKFFLVSLVVIFCIDQWLKTLFLEGLRWNGDYFSLVLTFNKGVAFSMLSFLDEYLKYIQLILIVGLCSYLIWEKETFIKYAFPAGIIAGAGLSNVFDRFIHGGVVDYLFWHYGFEFAVFNFADVMIDFGVVVILYLSWNSSKKA